MRIFSLLLFLLPFVSGWTQSKPSWKAAFITCQDASGVVLQRDTVRTPIEVCAFVRPPQIPYYRVSNYNEEGWNFCQTHDVHIVFEYRSESVPGVGKPLHLCTALNNNMSLLLSDTTAHALADGRTHYLMAGELGTTKVQWVSLPTQPAVTMGFPWRFMARDGAWALFNEAHEMFLSKGTSPTHPLQLGEEALLFTIERNKETGYFSLQSSEGEYLNFKNGQAVLGSQAQSFVLQHYWAAPFFALNLRATDTEGNEIQQFAKKFYAAGEELVCVAPPLKAWIFDAAATQHELRFAIQENTYIDLVYRADPTAIARVGHTAQATTNYDLSGRKVSHSTVGIVIRGGKKKLNGAKD